MGVAGLNPYGLEVVEVDIDFIASASEDAVINIAKPIREVLRGRLFIDADPGAGFAAWATYSFYNKAAKKGEDAFYRTAAKLVYTELEAATTGLDANITPDDQSDLSPNDLIVFLDDDEKARLKTIANTCIAEDTVGAHTINTGISRISEFSGLQLFNDESGTDVYLRIAFAVVQTVSLKMELVLKT